MLLGLIGIVFLLRQPGGIFNQVDRAVRIPRRTGNKILGNHLLTDNSGGTPSDTIPVLACESGCDCKHAIASLTKKTNTILAALRAVGIIASE